MMGSFQVTEYHRLLCVSLLAVLLSGLLSGCSAPVRAPVVSREQVPIKHRASRPDSHRVQKGDTLYAIAWHYGINYASIARWNGIAPPYTIYPGQRLRLTPGRRRPVTSRTGTKTPQTTGALLSGKAVASSESISKNSKKGVSSTQVTPPPARPVHRLQWLWPSKGAVVQRFVQGDPIQKGVKIQGRYGEPVKAAEAGKVVYAGSGLIGYGRLIIIKHNKNYLSAYGHNRKIHVKEGDTVNKGIRIAEMGSDGEGKPMLHFEIRRNGAPIDPLKLLPRHP